MTTKVARKYNLQALKILIDIGYQSSSLKNTDEVAL